MPLQAVNYTREVARAEAVIDIHNGRVRRAAIEHGEQRGDHEMPR